MRGDKRKRKRKILSILLFLSAENVRKGIVFMLNNFISF